MKPYDWSVVEPDPEPTRSGRIVGFLIVALSAISAVLVIAAVWHMVTT